MCTSLIFYLGYGDVKLNKFAALKFNFKCCGAEEHE